MADMNSLSLIGRVTKDAELKYTNAGTALTKFSIAVNRSVKKADAWVDEVSFFDLTLWGRQAEGLTKFLTKGKQIGVKGSLRQNRFEKDGVTTSRIEIQVDEIQLLGGGKDAAAPAPASGVTAGSGASDDEEIPF